jgi:hypothetical protein
MHGMHGPISPGQGPWPLTHAETRAASFALNAAPTAGSAGALRGGEPPQPIAPAKSNDAKRPPARLIVRRTMAQSFPTQTRELNGSNATVPKDAKNDAPTCIAGVLHRARSKSALAPYRNTVLKGKLFATVPSVAM